MLNACDDLLPASTFHRAEEFYSGVRRLVDVDFASSPNKEQEHEEQRTVEALCMLLDEYQEQSFLLDPSLEAMVSPLVGALRASLAFPPSARQGRVSKLLYWIAKVRGPKTTARFVSHDANDLSMLVTLLSRQPEHDVLASASWETRYFLLLWLSICVRLPFAFERVAAGTAEKIVEIGLDGLEANGKEADAAADLLGWVYARNDVDLQPLLRICENSIVSVADGVQYVGLLHALALVLKSSTAHRLSPFIPSLHSILTLLPASDDTKVGWAAARTRVKLVGRIALLQLQACPNRSCPPDEVESSIGELIVSLAHPDSMPRYAAAKYLARIALLLPPNAAYEALRLDQRIALRSVGTSVRDAASYVLWALARSLPASSITITQGRQIAEGLLCTACLDRDVSVRRAASAAWQEAVGRWAIFPHGIETLRFSDFFTVSVRHRAFLEGAVAIARFDEYCPALVQHLAGAGPAADFGILHYDPEVRALSARVLGKIAENRATEIVVEQIHLQLKRLPAVKKDWPKLEGVLLALAALAEAAAALPDQTERDVLLDKIFSSACDLYPSTRSLKSQSRVLEATLDVLGSSATAAGRIEERIGWLDIVKLAGEHSEATVHARAGSALRRIFNLAGRQAILDVLMTDLSSTSPARQQASAYMLGQIDYAQATLNIDLEGLCARLTAFVRSSDRQGAATVEARRNGIAALAHVSCCAWPRGATDDGERSEGFRAATDALFLGFTDYTNDSRGDVGSWVRVATVDAWAHIAESCLLADGMFARVIASTARLALDRLDVVRKAAGDALHRIAVRSAGSLPGLKQLQSLSRHDPKWTSVETAAAQVLPLLKWKQYRREVLEGAVCLTTQYTSSIPLIDYATTLPTSSCAVSGVGDELDLVVLLTELYALAKLRVTSNRVFIPLLLTLSSLAETGCLNAVASNSAGSSLLEKLLPIACHGLNSTKGAARLSAILRVITAFLGIPRVSTAAGAKLYLILQHPSAWLRQQAAEEAHAVLTSIGILQADDELATLLLDTHWSSEESLLTAARICDLLKDHPSRLHSD